MGSLCDMHAFQYQSEQLTKELEEQVLARIKNGDVLIGLSADVSFESFELYFEFETDPRHVYVSGTNNPDYDYPEEEGG